jgi:hypothetical protein
MKIEKIDELWESWCNGNIGIVKHQMKNATKNDVFKFLDYLVNKEDISETRARREVYVMCN